MNNELDIEKTADGSVTLYRSDIDEHYHSVKGAMAESRHVYINLGWRHFPAKNNPQKIRVFEVGFGTGLNAALTAKAALESGLETEYYSVELYPIEKDLIEKYTEYQPSVIKAEFQSVNEAEWDRPVKINPFFTLHKLDTSLIGFELPREIDVVYFDAFAPEKQPEMWEESIFRSLYDAMVPGGMLTTYCAKGAIRRLLEKTGFLTERLPGPPGGKREVLRATKPVSLPPDTLSTPSASDDNEERNII